MAALRILAIRNKGRDIPLFGAVVFGSSFLTVSHWDIPVSAMASLVLAGFILSAVATLLRVWSLFYVAGYRNRTLVTLGPYSICRNPIYLATTLGGMGIALTTGTLTYPLVVGLFLWSYFNVQIGAEERRLERDFGKRFAEYRANVPRLIPNFALLNEPDEYVARPGNFRRSMGDALWFIIGLGIVQVAMLLHAANMLPVLVRVY